MFDAMAERGPDSAGVAIFDQPVQEPLRRFNLLGRDRPTDWQVLLHDFEADTKAVVQADCTDNHAVWTTAVEPGLLRSWLDQKTGRPMLIAVGRAISLYKDVGKPQEIARRFRFAGRSGTHGIGHTRMATESAVSAAHAHPYTAGEDLCLVHNGSLSNPHMLRRMLESKGLGFQTDNDTEAACRYIQWRLLEGDSLEQAVASGFPRLDGFYTLLIATRDRMLLVRDAFACKPAVVAETDDYVAVGSEFRSLAKLPGVQSARIFEPKPEEICSWTVS
jgi:glutamate synthase domain-containing protein 1